MTKPSRLHIAKLRAFATSYDTSREDRAFRARGDFLRAFPKSRLSSLTVDDYVIGHQRPTFCDYVEAKTRPWANIQGSTSFKFGIYYGRTRTDPNAMYRFTLKYGDTKTKAFRAVRAALLDLVRTGGEPHTDFAAIDANPLSQLFKAKILSLYYQDRFLNVCSAEHLEMFGIELGFPDGLLASEYQNLLIKAKRSHRVTRSWSNPKFMAFLYETYVRVKQKPNRVLRKPQAKQHRRVSFEDVQAQRDAIGKAAEEYALSWEKERLRGADLGFLIPTLEDRRDRPGYGYDFLSYTSAKQRRYIEVKSVGKVAGGEGHRFFLSDNEHSISKSPEHREGYYFYLVFFDGRGEPIDLHPVEASDLYEMVEMTPASYLVRFRWRTD